VTSGNVSSIAARSITTLRLGKSPIGPAGARALAQSPGLPELADLWLPGCGLGDEGARAIAESPHFARLKSLHVSDNATTNDGARALAGSKGLPALTDLGIYDRPQLIDKDGADLLRARFAKVSLHERR
jgi:hypothetical protein